MNEDSDRLIAENARLRKENAMRKQENEWLRLQRNKVRTALNIEKRKIQKGRCDARDK